MKKLLHFLCDFYLFAMPFCLLFCFPWSDLGSLYFLGLTLAGTNYTPVLPHSGWVLPPPRSHGMSQHGGGEQQEKWEVLWKAGGLLWRPLIHLPGSPAGRSRSTWAATPPQPPLGSRTLALRSERGGTELPPSSSAFPEVYYYTNVNSRTGIWGAAAGS